MKYVRVKVNALLIISMILAIIGGIDWTAALFNFSFIRYILYPNRLYIMIAYTAIGLAAIYLLYPLYKMIKYPN